MRIIDILNESFETGITNVIFVHVRNYLICAFLYASGAYAMKHSLQLLFGTTFGQFTGFGIIILASVLALLNLGDGIHRFSRSRHHLLLLEGMVNIRKNLEKN